uniref:Putative secreted protein n=1 Tax=Ixodes ricinus TaxID=34613 RepID=V5H8D7_IXORI
MFKLKLFILFALAGLCFGEPSDGGSNPDQVSEDGSSSGDKESEAGGNGETGERPEASSETGNPIGLLNTSIPNFVGSYETKRSLVSSFVDNCRKEIPKTSSVESRTDTSEGTTEPSSPIINLKSVDFKNCTFVCKLPKNTTVMMPMPKGTVCDKHNKTCPGNGVCPTSPIPAC